MFYCKREDGFSLIEVLIATIVLCTIIPLTNYFINSMKTNNKTELQQTANYVAQKYMEEYKAKKLNEYTPMNDVKITDWETGFSVTINVLLDTIIEPYAAKMIVMGHIGSSVDIDLGGTSITGAVDGDTLVLRVIDTGTPPNLEEKVRLEKLDGTEIETINLQTPTPICADRLISLTVKDDPEITINAINELPSSRWVVFVMNKVGSCPNFVLNNEGKISTTNTAVTTERGARITVTVKKDDSDSEILAKVTQARKI